MNSSSWVLITGASSGIGRACAEKLAAAGYKKLFLLARRRDRLEELSSRLKSQGAECLWAAVDLADSASLEAFLKDHQAPLSEVGTLVNNAGLAKGLNGFQDSRPDEWEKMFRTNVFALMHLTRAILPHMIDRKDGHIINVGSVAGRWAYPKGNVYCASKAAVHMLTETLRMDLLGTGVRVSELCPGMVETEFSLVRLEDATKAAQVYAGMTPLTAEDVAEAVFWVLQRPKHVNIQEMVLYPTDQASPHHVHRSSK